MGLASSAKGTTRTQTRAEGRAREDAGETGPPKTLTLPAGGFGLPASRPKKTDFCPASPWSMVLVRGVRRQRHAGQNDVGVTRGLLRSPQQQRCSIEVGF